MLNSLKNPILRAIGQVLNQKKIKYVISYIMISPSERIQCIRIIHGSDRNVSISIINHNSTIVDIHFNNKFSYNVNASQHKQTIELETSDPKFFDQFINIINDTKYYK